MSLSCECYFTDPSWFFESPHDEAKAYTTLQTTKRKRCCSCGELIDIGETVVKLDRWRYPVTDQEASRAGGDDAEVVLAPWYLCERCGDIFWSLDELGFCLSIQDDMRELVREYAEMVKQNG